MMKVVEALDKEAALGLLARTALSISNDAVGSIYDNAKDEIFREELLVEARRQLGISDDDDSLLARERIADLLDSESDRINDLDMDAALNRLAKRGDLPSDIYNISIINNIETIYSKYFVLEKKIIEKTIKDPGAEQHLVPNKDNIGQFAISLFVRLFRTKWPLKDFFMLVAGERSGMNFIVHQAWRLYPLLVSLSDSTTLVEWLERFADVYGLDVEIRGEIGHFFKFANDLTNKQIKILQHKDSGHITMFTNRGVFANNYSAAMIVAINSTKYMSMYEDMVVRERDMNDFDEKETYLNP